MQEITISYNQAKRFAMECYDIIISEIKAEREQEKEVIEDGSEEGSATARS